MLASSAQASLVGRYSGSEYGKAKLACEDRLRAYAMETGTEILIYRFPNVFGKWCRPDYNSAVATFAITSRVICRLRLMTRQPSWSFSILMT